MDADKLKDFFLYHGEKFVVAIVAAASVWMFYSGLQMPNILEKHQPDRLVADANSVRASIDDDHTEAIVDPRVPDFDIIQETLKKQTAVDPKPYKLPNLLERKNIESSLRRQDPTLMAPKALQVSGHICSMAAPSSSGNYALSDLENAEALEVVEQKKAPAPRSRGRGRGRGMDMEMMDMEMMDMEMMDMDMGMGMDGGMGMATGAGRKLNPKYAFGIRPVPKDGKKPVPRSAWFIAGTAVIPHKTIAESYKSALADAEGYSARRDQPLYFNYEIQRAEVTNKTVDQLQDNDWKLISTREADLKRAIYQWSGFAPELVPEDYRDPNVTGYIPPVMLCDYSRFTLHPLIPMQSRRALRLEEAENQPVEEEVKPEDLELATPGGGGGEFGMDMDMGMGMDMDMGMDMGMGMSMMTIDEDPVDYKLMRFFDFARGGGDPLTPLPGRSYVYRVRFSVVDPNFPASALQQPKVSTLSGDVYTRVRALMADAEANKKRQFQRWSDWSEPSPPASLPTLNNYFAGPVEPASVKDYSVQGKPVQFEKTPPKAKVLNYAFDPRYATVVPIWIDGATEGTVLSYQGEAEAIDPITLQIKKLPDAKVSSGNTIIDLEGGRELTIVEDESQTEPGMMLLFDENGGLSVTGEVQDQEMYRIYSFSEERGL